MTYMPHPMSQQLKSFICSSKKYFRFEKHAKQELIRGIRKGYLRDGFAYIYQCNECPGYHISNGDRRTRWKDKMQQSKDYSSKLESAT